MAGDERRSADSAERRKQRLQRSERDRARADPWLDSFGVGAGRKELHRLMLLYSRGKEGRDKDEKSSTVLSHRALPAAIHSRMVNISKIRDVVQKLPWERSADEVEKVRKSRCGLSMVLVRQLVIRDTRC